MSGVELWEGAMARLVVRYRLESGGRRGGLVGPPCAGTTCSLGGGMVVETNVHWDVNRYWVVLEQVCKTDNCIRIS